MVNIMADKCEEARPIVKFGVAVVRAPRSRTQLVFSRYSNTNAQRRCADGVPDAQSGLVAHRSGACQYKLRDRRCVCPRVLERLSAGQCSVAAPGPLDDRLARQRSGRHAFGVLRPISVALAEGIDRPAQVFRVAAQLWRTSSRKYP